MSNANSTSLRARHSPHFKMNAEELIWISGRVAVLEDLVGAICRDHLAALARARAAE
ncbi:hypothetical protein [Sphingopyxis flava]|uniref:hypothetical protein n=1 Tax=Sphingopyxis flava TaxID=1507287 RepID=UPI001591AC27|nr:hypothetical protein [Sphingopyxis flava]